jgi:ABC-type siderophore export system fused ATPase/permease subunit
MIRFTNQMLYDFELAMIEGIKESEFEPFSRLDSSLVYTAIGDIRTIAQLPRYFADMVNYIMIILICLTYLFILSPLCGLVVLSCGVLMIIFYRKNNRGAVRLLRRSRELENQFYDQVSDLMEGFRYVKLDDRRAKGIFEDHISVNRSLTREAETGASLAYTRNELLGSYGWLIILGIPVFLLPLFYPPLRSLAGSVTIAILYIMAPVGSLLSALPFLARTRVAMDRIGSLRKKLELPDQPVRPFHPPTPEHRPAAGVFESLCFEEVVYRYPASDAKERFTLGPVSLGIRKGDLIFITGDNGSGKSTFLHLVSGLLSPTTGTIRLNDQPLTAAERSAIRNRISAVFVEGFLFRKDYRPPDRPDNGELFHHYLELLQLDRLGLTPGDSGRQLSRGQQKRMALLRALLEEKEILVLDEWAAEQDPSFRYHFYNRILPELSAQGKTIVAVTHDDRYFEKATRLFHFGKGRLVEAGMEWALTP